MKFFWLNKQLKEENNRIIKENSKLMFDYDCAEKEIIRKQFLHIDRYNRKVEELEKEDKIRLETHVTKQCHEDLKETYYNLLKRFKELQDAMLK